MSIKVRNEDKEFEEVYTKSEVYSKNEVYGKSEVYSKSETDNVQTATITVNEESGNGKADIIFTRIGRVVFVRINITIFANKNSVMIVEQLNSIIPDFAKTNSIKGQLITGFMSNGGSTINDYDVVLTNFAKANIVAYENGNYLFLVNALNGTVQETDSTITITGCYVTDKD